MAAGSTRSDPSVFRWALGIEYDGSGFCGWQRQVGQASVQAAVETALTRIAQQAVEVVVAGRTDTGVHALCQVAHFDTTVDRPDSAWVRGGSVYLPEAVSIRWARPVETAFHARFSATARRYRYIILNRRQRPALFRQHYAWVYRPLQVERMQAAARSLLGTHDFSAFRAAACQARQPVRELRLLQVSRRGEQVIIDAEADGFLHHMVRNLAGVLIAIGAGERPVSWAAEVLASRDRRLAGTTAPPGGLYFVAPRYPDAFALPIDPALPFAG
ncbi:MAG: tRNA pseudouridine(38-40) synthase TruA [Gammaproteobacteria bacterium]|nr:tRNA pseudouridine(38-40) synthase TruA [Gammaproteobacteria bacterium]